MLSPRMAATAVISTAVYLGLAIVCDGGFDAFFSHGALIALTLATLAMIVASIFSNATLSSGVREDRNNRWVIAALGVFGVAAAIVPPLCDRFDILVFDGENMRWLGVLLYVIGGALRLAPTFILGESVQRPRRDPAWPPPGHHRALWGDPQPELPRPDHLFARLGDRVPFRDGDRPRRADPDPAARAHEFRGAAARGNFWRGIRGLSRAHLAACARCLLEGFPITRNHRHCEERSDAAIRGPRALLSARDCFAPLAMTELGALLPLPYRDSITLRNLSR